MNIYASDNRTGKATMRQLQKLIARKYPARVSTEGRQQIQFRARQTDANAELDLLSWREDASSRQPAK